MVASHADISDHHCRVLRRGASVGAAPPAYPDLSSLFAFSHFRSVEPGTLRRIYPALPEQPDRIDHVRSHRQQHVTDHQTNTT